MSFLRHEEIYRSDVGVSKAGSGRLASSLPALIGFDEFPVGYSLAGCPPAEPVSASPTGNDSQQSRLPYNDSSANGNNPLNFLSQPKGALQRIPQSPSPWPLIPSPCLGATGRSLPQCRKPPRAPQQAQNRRLPGTPPTRPSRPYIKPRLRVALTHAVTVRAEAMAAVSVLILTPSATFLADIRHTACEVEEQEPVAGDQLLGCNADYYTQAPPNSHRLGFATTSNSSSRAPKGTSVPVGPVTPDTSALSSRTGAQSGCSVRKIAKDCKVIESSARGEPVFLAHS
jgi:hypothetical protein